MRQYTGSFLGRRQEQEKSEFKLGSAVVMGESSGKGEEEKPILRPSQAHRRSWDSRYAVSLIRNLVTRYTFILHMALLNIFH